MKKYLNNSFIIFFMMLTFFKPICLQYYSGLQIIEKIFLFGKIFSAFIIILYSILSSYPKIKINKYCIFLFLFEIWMLFTTIVFKGNIFRSFTDFITIFSLALMILTFYKINKDKLFIVLRNLLIILTLLQLASEIIFPSGMNADLYLQNSSNPLFFVTLDNGTIYLTCLTITLIELCNEYVKKNKKIVNIFQISICLLTAFLSGSSTALLCTLLLVFFIKFSRWKNLRIFDKWRIWLLGYFAILFLILTNNEFISNIISLLTGKGTFTGRNLLWNEAIQLIKLSPFYGYGRSEVGHIDIWYGNFSSHNFILEMLLEGGIIALILWFCVILTALSKIKYISNLKIKRIFILSIFIFFIALSMEAQVHSVFLFVIISLLYAHNSEIKGEKNE